MNFRILVGSMLLFALAACSGERPASVLDASSPDSDVNGVLPADTAEPDPDPNDVLPGGQGAGKAAAADDAGPEDEAAEDDPGPAAAPVELNLRLPQEQDLADDSLFPLTPEPRLPDMFQENERQRRTTISGELFLGDEEEKGFNLDRVQGGSVEVEVSID